MNNSIEWTDFIKVEMRVGTIIKVQKYLRKQNPPL